MRIKFGPDDVEKLLERMVDGEPIGTLAKLGYIPSRGHFLGKAVSKETAMRWLSQFDDEDIHSAIEILRNVTYFSVVDVRIMCRLALIKLLNEHSFELRAAAMVPVGQTAKSGQLISYFFRTSTLGQNLHFIDPELIPPEMKQYKHIVFLDDYVGTGKQFSEWWARSEFNAPSNEIQNQYYLALVGTSSGLNAIREKTRVEVVCLQERHDHWDFRYTQIDDIDSFLKKYGSGLFVASGSDQYLGYGECRAAIAFFYNVPNNTVPVIWSTGTNSRNQQWFPLFARSSGIEHSAIDGINTLLDQISSGQKISIEDFVFMCELITDVRHTVVWPEIPIRDLEVFVRLISEFLCILSGRDDLLPVHPPKLAYLFIGMRQEIISHIAEKCISMPLPSIQPLLSLFVHESYSMDQDTRIAYTLLRKIIEVLSGLNKMNQLRCVREALNQVTNSNRLSAEGAYLVISALINDDSAGPEIRIRDMESLEPSSDHGCYYRLALLAQLDENYREDLKGFLTPEMREKIYVTVNAYGKIRSFPLSHFPDRLIV